MKYIVENNQILDDIFNPNKDANINKVVVQSGGKIFYGMEHPIFNFLLNMWPKTFGSLSFSLVLGQFLSDFFEFSI